MPIEIKYPNPNKQHIPISEKKFKILVTKVDILSQKVIQLFEIIDELKSQKKAGRPPKEKNEIDIDIDGKEEQCLTT